MGDIDIINVIVIDFSCRLHCIVLNQNHSIVFIQSVDMSFVFMDLIMELFMLPVY